MCPIDIVYEGSLEEYARNHNLTFANASTRADCDYLGTDEGRSLAIHEKLLFMIQYIIIIPIFLIIVSRIIRCLRKRGIISQGSSEYMYDECTRRVNTVLPMTATPTTRTSELNVAFEYSNGNINIQPSSNSLGIIVPAKETKTTPSHIRFTLWSKSLIEVPRSPPLQGTGSARSPTSCHYWLSTKKCGQYCV